MFGQLIVSGLAVGACYALLALAMVIIYKSSEVLNFAQGEMAMVSTFVAFMLLDAYHVPFPWAAGLTFLFAILLGIFFEIVFLRHRAHHHYPRFRNGSDGVCRMEMGAGSKVISLSSFKHRSLQFLWAHYQQDQLLDHFDHSCSDVHSFSLFPLHEIGNCHEGDATEPTGRSRHGHPDQMDPLFHLGH